MSQLSTSGRFQKVTPLQSAGRADVSRHNHQRPVHAASNDALPAIEVVESGRVEIGDAEYTAAVQALAALIGEWKRPGSAWPTAA